jgi:hypothetical protein
MGGEDQPADLMFARFWSWLFGKKAKSSSITLEDGTDLLTEAGATLDLEN